MSALTSLEACEGTFIVDGCAWAAQDDETSHATSILFVVGRYQMPFLNWSDLARFESAPGRAIRMVDGQSATLIRLECTGPTVLDSHIHEETEQVSVVLDGEMEFSLGGEVRTVGPGDVVLVPNGVSHGMRVKEGKKAVAVEFFTPPREDLRAQMRSAH